MIKNGFAQSAYVVKRNNSAQASELVFLLILYDSFFIITNFSVPTAYAFTMFNVEINVIFSLLGDDKCANAGLEFVTLINGLAVNKTD